MIFTKHHKWGYRKCSTENVLRLSPGRDISYGKIHAFATLDNFDFNLTQNLKHGV
jgi:hypothetical protein